MSDSKYVVSLKFSSKKSELQGYLDDGKIDANSSFGQEISKAENSNHISIIDGWISNYGKTQGVKNLLQELKKKSSSTKKECVTETIIDGKSITFFIVAFSDKYKKEDGDYERDYYEAHATVELTASEEDYKKIIRGYTQDLAILFLSGGSEKYTLQITE